MRDLVACLKHNVTISMSGEEIMKERDELRTWVKKLEEENARLQKENAGLKEYVRELQEEIQDFIDRG